MLDADEKKVVLTFPAEDLKKFKEIHPAHGAFTWFCREALRRYVSLNHIDPGMLVEEAVRGIEVTVRLDDI